MTTLTTALARSKTPIKSPKLPSPGERQVGPCGPPHGAASTLHHCRAGGCGQPIRRKDDDDDEGGGEEGDEEELGLTRSIHF